MKSLKIRIYDNGGKTRDRYTVIYMYLYESGHGRNKKFGARGMCSNPTSPQGIGCYVSANPGRHLGRRIKLEDLPKQARDLVLFDLREDGQE